MSSQKKLSFQAVAIAILSVAVGILFLWNLATWNRLSELSMWTRQPAIDAHFKRMDEQTARTNAVINKYNAALNASEESAGD